MAKKLSQLATAVSLLGTELVLLSKRSTTVTYTATTISALASDNSLNDSAAQFIVEGFAVDDTIVVAGFTGNVANNLGSGTIETLTAGKMIIATPDGTLIVDDAAGESVTITKLDSVKTTVAELVAGASTGGLVVQEYVAAAWTPTARNLFIRRVGDPDPTSTMSDGDLLIDLSSDTTPSAITFTPRTNALPSFSYQSTTTHTLSGLTGTADVSITGGEWRKSSDSGSNYTAWGSSSGTALNGDFVQVRGTSSGTASGVTTVALTVGGVTGNFVITTASTIETFAGAAGAYTGGTLFDISNAGTGTTTLDGSGGMVQTSTATSAAAMARRKTAFNTATARKYRRHFRLTATSGAMVFALQKNLNSNASQLNATTNATWGTNNRNVVGIADDGVFFYRDASNVAVGYNAATNAWGSSGAVTLSLATDYILEIESDGTSMRMALYDANDTLIEQTPYVAWSSILTVGSFAYVSFGDYLTDFWTVTATTYTYTED